MLWIKGYSGQSSSTQWMETKEVHCLFQLAFIHILIKHLQYKTGKNQWFCHCQTKTASACDKIRVERVFTGANCWCWSGMSTSCTVYEPFWQSISLSNLLNDLLSTVLPTIFVLNWMWRIFQNECVWAMLCRKSLPNLILSTRIL